MPSLSIPIKANLDDFKKAMNETSSLAQTAARKVAQQFLEANKALATGAASAMFVSASQAALGYAGKLALVVGAVKLMGDAIGETRERLKEMVAVADKASNLNVSPEFLQTWNSAAKGATDKVELFEQALQHAYQATKPLLNPDWSVWDDGLTKVNAVEKAMREARELFNTSQNFSGFELFKDANSQDQRIKGVLLYMRQLKDIGQEIVALDIGEKMFGSQFTDQVRLGRESFDEMLRTIQTGSKETFISNENAKNAKELDDKLNDAWNTIHERLKPDWDDLASVALRIKGIWAEIIDAISKAKLGTAQFPQAPGTVSDADARNNPDPNSAAFGNPVLLNQYRRRNGMAPDLSPASPQSPSQASGWDAWTTQNDLTQGPPSSTAGLPLPRRRPQDAPEPPKATAGAGPDRFDTSADSIEKRAAALQAEAGAIDLGTAAREKSKITAQLETVAKQANAAAGKGENIVTQEQRDTINEVANAYSNAALAMEKAKVSSSIKFGQQTGLLSPDDVAIASQLKNIYPDVATALNSVEASGMRANSALSSISATASSTLTTGLTDIFDGTKSVSQGFADMSKVIVRALEEALVKMLIVAPLMRSLQTLMGGGGLLGLFGFSGGGAVGGGATSAMGDPTGLGGLYDSGGFTGAGGKYQPAGIVHKGEYVFSQAATNRIGVGNLERLHRGYADGGAVGRIMPPASPMPSDASSGSNGPQKVHVTVGVSVDGNGNLQGYVKDVAQKTTQQGISGFVRGPQFPAHVGAAMTKARSSNFR